MRMPDGHLRMIEAVVKSNPNTVVVLFSGSAVECPWADRVKAILYMGPARAGGRRGRSRSAPWPANPCGRLAESWPLRYEDVPSSGIYGKTADALYQEGVYVGYRYYDKAGVPVRWPFGYGLSYTDFSYSGLQTDGSAVSVTVQNIGKRAGAEVVQLYVEAPQNGLHRPLRELRRFQKIFLQPGESTTVSFLLDERCFAVWQDGWKAPGGRYALCIGGLKTAVERSGDALAHPVLAGGELV